jgi:hypothetical protein
MNPFKIFKGVGSKTLVSPETTAVRGLLPDAPQGFDVKPTIPPQEVSKEWTHVTPPGVVNHRGVPSAAEVPKEGPKEWTHVTPPAALDRRNMPSPKFDPAPPKAPDAAEAKAKKKMGWKAKAGVIGGVGAAGWLANDMSHSFNPQSPNPQQYQTAGDNGLADRLEKTARDTINRNHKEASEMGIMERLEKTASVIEAIHSIAQATGHSPEEIAQLADESPEEFMQLHQQLMGGEGVPAGPEEPQAPGAAQPETQGMPQSGPQVPQEATPQEVAPQGNPAAAPQAAEQAVPQAAEQAAEQAVPQGGVAQAVSQGAPQAEAPVAQAQMGTPVGGGVDHSGLLQAISQAASQGAQEGAQQAINQMGGGDASANPRSGAASVSHNPAGVDKTASDSDMLILRLEQTADALADTAKIMRNVNQEPNDNQVKTASLMASLEKTAEENSFGNSVGKGAIIGGTVLGGLGALAGGISGMNASRGEGLLLGAAVGAGGALLGGMSGAVPGTVLGGAAGGAHHLAFGGHKEHEASESLMDSLEKTALSLGGIGTGIKNFAKNVSGVGVKNANKELGVVKEQRELANQPENFIAKAKQVGVSDARNHLETLETNMGTATANVGKSIADRTKARGQAAIGAGGLVTGGMLAGDKQKTAFEEPVAIEKIASENEIFMDGIFKEAAAHIIQMEMPKTKIYVDPMSKIRF